ncbi:MAG: glycosyltransferase family 2 protein [bacterium]
MHNKCELTILMPCLNEAKTLETCIRKARTFIESYNISAEILIADNGSSDDSANIALKEGARIIQVPIKGYGSALIAGINAAKGKYIIMGDADDSYDFLDLAKFINKLREGYDFVMGNRFEGGIKKGAMPLIHRYFGNPVLSFTGRLFFKSPINDFNCGLRGFDTEKIKKLGLVTLGMEFASEMVVKATIFGYKMTEVPIILYPDGRNCPPHLKTWHDGWNQLVFLLMHSPKWLFFIPSLLFFFISVGGLLCLLPGTVYFNKVGLDIHTLTIAGFMVILSYQLFLFAVFIRVFSLSHGLYIAKNKHKYFYNIFSLERGIIFGFMMLISGLGILTFLLNKWIDLDFGRIQNVSSTFRLLIPSVTLISLGIQTVFASFFLKILGISSKISYPNENP